MHPIQAEVYKVKKSREHTSTIGEASTRQGVSSKKRILVLYGSETGTAEGYAFDTAARLRQFSCHVRDGTWDTSDSIRKLYSKPKAITAI